MAGSLCEPLTFGPGPPSFITLLVDFDDFAAGVVAAVRADRVLEAHRLALLTGLEIGQAESEVAAPAPLPRLR